MVRTVLNQLCRQDNVTKASCCKWSFDNRYHTVKAMLGSLVLAFIAALHTRVTHYSTHFQDTIFDTSWHRQLFGHACCSGCFWPLIFREPGSVAELQGCRLLQDGWGPQCACHANVLPKALPAEPKNANVKRNPGQFLSCARSPQSIACKMT
jgi:hypothetical protein